MIPPAAVVVVISSLRAPSKYMLRGSGRSVALFSITCITIALPVFRDCGRSRWRPQPPFGRVHALKLVVGTTHSGGPAGPFSGVGGINSIEAGFEAGGRVGSQSAFELLLRGGASMRFHPKSRASTDQRPGPNIAKAPPMVAAKRQTNESSPMVIRQISIMATSVPVRGVHSPAMRRSPDAVRDTDVSVVCIGASLHSFEPARNRRTEPTTRRMSSNPMPGQLPANVE